MSFGQLGLLGRGFAKLGSDGAGTNPTPTNVMVTESDETMLTEDGNTMILE